ncbi:MAG TPA: hypothetical protein VGO86_05370 [Candidatus Dormibacteraeota bacterium]|jgi:hypothetical protein
MSPLAKVEVNVFIEIAASLHRWADALEDHAESVGDLDIGPGWPEEDLVELYQAWLSVGNAIRDIARTRPSADADESRPELLAIRDGLSRIADIAERQVEDEDT